MKLAGRFNGTKTSYIPKDQGKFGFSFHDPFNMLETSFMWASFSLHFVLTII